MYMQRNLKQQIPESTGTQDTNERKGRRPCLKSRKYGNIFPSPPGSLPQKEGGGHYKLLKVLCGSRTEGQVPATSLTKQNTLFDPA
jgi:hypothetical protein